MEVALSGLWAPGFSVYTRAFRRVSMVLGECVVYKDTHRNGHVTTQFSSIERFPFSIVMEAQLHVISSLLN